MDKEKQEWFDGLVSSIGRAEAATTNIIQIQQCDGCGEWRDAARIEESWIEEHYEHRTLLRADKIPTLAGYNCKNCSFGEFSAIICDECHQKRMAIAARPELSAVGISESFAGALRGSGLVGTLKPIDSALGINANPVPFPGTIYFKQPKYYKYTPQKDITVYELALMIPLLSGVGALADLEKTPHWEEIKRHFTEIED